jgi:hypothetical protein
MEQLVEEKVDAFWKGLENVALKQGEVRRSLYFCEGWLTHVIQDFSHTVKKRSKKGLAWDYYV